MIQRLLNLSLEQKNTTYIQTLQVSTVHCFVLQVIHIERSTVRFTANGKRQNQVENFSK